MFDPLIGTHVVAQRLGVKRSDIYEWLHSSMPLPAYRVGKTALRFRWSEVTAWLDARRGAESTVRSRVRAPRPHRSASRAVASRL